MKIEEGVGDSVRDLRLVTTRQPFTAGNGNIVYVKGVETWKSSSREIRRDVSGFLSRSGEQVLKSKRENRSDRRKIRHM